MTPLSNSPTLPWATMFAIETSFTTNLTCAVCALPGERRVMVARAVASLHPVTEAGKERTARCPRLRSRREMALARDRAQ